MLNDLQAVETYGGIDILVSNAGINPSYATFLEVRSQLTLACVRTTVYYIRDSEHNPSSIDDDVDRTIL